MGLGISHLIALTFVPHGMLDYYRVRSIHGLGYSTGGGVLPDHGN